MIQPGSYDIIIQQNGDWDITFQLKDTSGVGINLTGSTVEAEIWTEHKQSKLADFGVTYVDRSIGKFKLTLTDTVTATLPENGYYDVRVIESGGLAYYWVRGRAVVETGYTE
jgi:hypothetical protein